VQKNQMKHWASMLFGKQESGSEQTMEALEEKYFRELVCQAESVDGQFEEYVEHLRGSVDDCIKKYCVLNDLFERKIAIKINGLMSVLSDKLVEKFKELELEREKQQKWIKKEREKEDKRHARF
jgi:hypothetical protein